MTVVDFISTCTAVTPPPFDRTLDGNKENGRNIWSSHDRLKNELEETLRPGDEEERIGKLEIERMKMGLINHWILERKQEAKGAYDLLTALTGLLGPTFERYQIFESEEWRKALSLLKGYVEVDSNLIETDDLLPNKYKERASAALKLRNLGYSISVDGFEIMIDDEAVCNALDSRVRRYGGLKFIETFLAGLPYNKELGRFIVPKSVSTIPTEPTVYDWPCNYILNLALKHVGEKGDARFQTTEYFQDTIALFSTFCYARYEVQSSSLWDNLYPIHKEKLRYIRDLIYRESIFDLHQSSVGFIRKLIRFIIASEVRQAEESKNVPLPYLKDLSIIIDHLLSHSRTRTFERLDLRRLSKTGKSNTGALSLMIDGFSISEEDLNKDFLYPTDYDKVNYWNFPIVRMKDGSCLMMPSAILSRSCYEALLSQIRIKDADIDERIGPTIESFIYDLFKKSGIDVETGKYSFKQEEEGKQRKIDGECDGLIELNDALVLMEMKKKSLIRLARSGDDAQILIDLKDSLLSSQIQGMKTQLALSKGPIRLKKGDACVEVNQAGRKIHKWSVVLLPFGDIQDRLIISQILNIFINSSFEYRLGDESQLSAEELEVHLTKKKKIEMLGKKQKEFRQYLDWLGVDRPFFTSMFLDAEKIMVLLHLNPTKKALEECIRTLNSVTFGTLDFYREISLLKRML